MKACEDYIRNRDITISELTTMCDICVHDSKYGCKLKSDNRTELVHGYNRRPSGRVRVFK